MAPNRGRGGGKQPGRKHGGHKPQNNKQNQGRPRIGAPRNGKTPSRPCSTCKKTGHWDDECHFNKDNVKKYHDNNKKNNHSNHDRRGGGDGGGGDDTSMGGMPTGENANNKGRRDKRDKEPRHGIKALMTLEERTEFRPKLPTIPCMFCNLVTHWVEACPQKDPMVALRGLPRNGRVPMSCKWCGFGGHWSDECVRGLDAFRKGIILPCSQAYFGKIWPDVEMQEADSVE